MIVAAAFCPHPPVLVPDVAQAAAPELADLRAACRTAIQRIALPGRQLAIIGAGERSAWFTPGTRGSLAGYGVDLEVSLGSELTGQIELPLSLTVGAWLLHDALGRDAVADAICVGPDWWDRDPFDLGVFDREDFVLLVMGDGSARRSTAAPGYLDDRAAAFDADVVAAMRSGNGLSLLEAYVDPDTGAELLAAGVPVWNAVGSLLGDLTFDAEVLYDAAPYGVGYVVATWT